MKIAEFTAVLNVTSRLAAALGRLALVWSLARWMTPDDVGRFSLMVTSVTLGTYLVGLELHTFVGRELASVDPERRVQVIRDQFYLYVGSYLISLPALSALFALQLLPWSLAAWFYPLLVTEHLATELQRNLVFVGRPLLSSFLLFLRNSAWALAAFPWLWAHPHDRGLTPVWTAWLCGSALSIALALVALRGLPWRLALSGPDKHWMRRALRTVPLFFAIALLQRALFSVDRYTLQHLVDASAVGIYAFFFSITNVLSLVSDSGVGQLLAPRLIRARTSGDHAEAARIEARLLWRGAWTICSTAALLAISTQLLLGLIGKPIYQDALPTFWVLLAAAAVFALGNLARVVLFARRADDKALLAYTLGTSVALVLPWVLTPRLSHLGAALSTLAACTVVAVVNFSSAWARHSDRAAPGWDARPLQK